MRVAAGAGVGGAGQHVAVLRVVQRVVEPRDRPDRIAEGGVGGHVLNALAVDIDLAAITQGLHVLRAGIGTGAVGDDIFGLHGAVSWPPPPTPSRKGEGSICESKTRLPLRERVGGTAATPPTIPAAAGPALRCSAAAHTARSAVRSPAASPRCPPPPAHRFQRSRTSPPPP